MKSAIKTALDAMEDHAEALQQAKRDNNMRRVEWHRDRLWYWQNLYRDLCAV